MTQGIDLAARFLQEARTRVTVVRRATKRAGVGTGDGPLDFVRRFPDKCCAEVSRQGESQPCDKTAVAVTYGEEGERWWPVCAYHCRGRAMVPLTEVVKCLLETGWWEGWDAVSESNERQE